MKINNIIYQSTSLSREKYNNKSNNATRVSTPQMANDSVSFTGINKLDPRNLRKLDDYTRRMLYYSKSILGVSSDVLKTETKNYSKPQKELFGVLVDKYNVTNFEKAESEKENPMLIFSMVKKIKFPTEGHYFFAASRRFSMKEAAECMEKLNYSASKLSKFQNLSREIRHETDASNKQIMQILNSENAHEYISNPIYEPYFKRHMNEPNSVKKLDEMVATGTYDAVKEKKIYNLERTIKAHDIKNYLDVDKLAPHSSKESNTILRMFEDLLDPHRLKDKEDYAKNLSEIYSTTTKDNFNARADYLLTYKVLKGAHDYSRNEMSNINKLFKKMDEDPSVMNFMRKVSVPKTNTTGAGGFLKILEEVSPEKRDLYADNIKAIMSGEIKNAADKAVKFCALQPGSVVGKITKGFKKSLSSIFVFNKHETSFRTHRKRYNRTTRHIEVPPSEKAEVITDNSSKKVQSNLPAVIYRFPKLDLSKQPYQAPVLPRMSDIVGGTNKLKFNVPTPVIVEKSIVTESKMPTLPAVIYDIPKLELPTATPVAEKTVEKVSQPVEEVVNSVAAPVKTAQKTIKRGIFVNRVAKQPSAKKLAVISDVNNIIEKKLGKNTLADQSKSYERGATKMRAGMLPEIFDSIKETRAQKRAAGTFSKTKSESNADALTLYQMINGRNKKLVNYMLKVRNEDGTRMYSVKDIISTVGETEKKIMMSKLKSTKEAPITAVDAKNIYAAMLDEQVSQHGKLPRAKKK